ncbi:MAG: hypothetical protein HQ526_04900 [Actinobacteria bacterium]|nr:hypothetical protein [Actinomycetota bacterium]
MTTTGADLIMALLRTGQISLSDLDALQTMDAPSPSRSHLEHYPRALAECPRASLSTYKSNFRRLAERFGETSVDTVTT